jgi:alpha-tubulin suppressor-like RCC1 family protein
MLLSGCGGPHSGEPVGSLELRLATDVNGLRYQLANATFNVTGPETTTIIPSPNSYNAQVTLDQGNYTIDLQNGWVLEKSAVPGGVLNPVAAQLVSPDPFNFTISQGATTRVGYSFLVDGSVIGMGEGTLDLSIDVTDPNNQPRVYALAAGAAHTCALIGTGSVRCWGFGLSGQLGYGNTASIGDDETPSSAGDVPVGGNVKQLAAGTEHTCALLTTGAVRCWGRGQSGQLGYGNANNVGDNETPASLGDVPLGASARAIACGNNHTCAVLTSGAVRCWGKNSVGQLGYGNTLNIGDDEPLSILGNVNLGGNAAEIAAGGDHTCVRMEGSSAVRCWGSGASGELGYANTQIIGDNELPNSAGDVNVGAGVAQITAGGSHTCARFLSGAVRCWGLGVVGRLGYGNTNSIGDNETPASAGDVSLGGTATSIAAGGTTGQFAHTCALLSTGAVRCWGLSMYGQLSYYPNMQVIGDNETPASVGDVAVGSPVAQIAVGDYHTCAILQGSGAVRCWGVGTSGQLGYGNTNNIGDSEPPGSAGNVSVMGGSASAPTPGNLGPIAWYSAESSFIAIDQSDGVGVARWDDRSGQNNHITQAVNAAQPSFDANGWASSQGAVVFAAQQSLDSSASIATAFNGNDVSFSVLAVIRPASDSDGAVATWDSGSSSFLRARVSDGGPLLRFQAAGTDGVVFSNDETAVLSATSGNVVAWIRNGTTVTLRTDGNAADSGTVDAVSISTNAFRVGSAQTFNNLFFSGRIAELVVVPRALTDGEYSEFRAYARTKWAGLP